MIAGALGCLLAALILGEPLYLLLKPSPPAVVEKPEVDVVFVLDATSSMQFAIDGTREGINGFAASLQESDLDAQVGLIAFRDRIWEPPLLDIVFVLDQSGSMQDEIDGIRDGIQEFALGLEKKGLDIRLGMVTFINSLSTGSDAAVPLMFNKQFLTKDYRLFRDQVGTLTARGGGNNESSYYGLATAIEQEYRKSTQRLLILITDEPPLIPDLNIQSTAQMGRHLEAFDNCQLICLTDPFSKVHFEQLGTYVPMQFYNLEENGNRVDFAYLLPKVAGQIITQFTGKGSTSDTGSTPEDPLIKEPQILLFEGQQFTSTVPLFQEQLSQIKASGGGDIPESSLDALSTAADFSFRENAEKVVLLITDAPPRIPDKDNQDLAAVQEKLIASQINQLHLITLDEFREDYSQLQLGPLSGQYFSLADAVNLGTFDQMLPQVSREIAENTLQGLSTTDTFSAGDNSKLILLVSTWSGLLSAGICLMLVIAQNSLLKNNVLNLKQLLQGGGGSMLTGSIAGLVGQVLFQALTNTVEGETTSIFFMLLSRIVAWGVLGTLLALLMTLFVPNLDWRYSLLGGVLGGCAGALGFQLLASLTAIVGRLVGATILGTMIGLVVAWSEWLSRDLCLSIQYNEKETVKINLGKTPVTIGSARRCMVHIAGVHELMYRIYSNDQNQIVCHALETDTKRLITAGYSFAVKSVNFRIEAKSKNGPTGTLHNQQNGPLPPPPPKKQPVSRPLDFQTSKIASSSQVREPSKIRRTSPKRQLPKPPPKQS